MSIKAFNKIRFYVDLLSISTFKDFLNVLSKMGRIFSNVLLCTPSSQLFN